jgi:hypothetical protein
MGSTADADERAVAAFRKLEELMLTIFAYAPERMTQMRKNARDATPANIATALGEIVTLQEALEFYQGLQRWDLAPALRSAGVFEANTDALVATIWASGDYLIKAAAETPSEVEEILCSIDSDQPITVRQLLLVTLALPDSSFRKVMKRGRWLRHTANYAFRREAVLAIRRLIDLHELDSAFALGKRFLVVHREPSLSTLAGFDHDHAVPDVNVVHFHAVIDEVPLVLAAGDPMRALRTIASMLDTAIRIEGFDRHDITGHWYDDFLSEARVRLDGKAMLTEALARVAFLAAATHREDVLAFLRRREEEAHIYRRLASAVIVRYGDLDDAMPSLMSVQGWRYGGPEHRALVERFYPKLDEARRAEIFALAQTQMDDLLRPHFGRRDLLVSEIDRRIAANVAERFGNALEAIAEPDRYRLRDAVNSTSVPEQRPLPTTDELAALSPDELISLLRSWPVEADTVLFPPRDSIGRSLRTVFLQNGQRWLTQSARVLEIPDDLLGWALNGLHEYSSAASESDDAALFAIAAGSIDRATAIAAANNESAIEAASHIAQGAGLLMERIARRPTKLADTRRILEVARTLAAIPGYRTSGERSPWNALSASLGDPAGLSAAIIDELLAATEKSAPGESEIIEAYDRMTVNASIVVRARLGLSFTRFAHRAPERAEIWASRLFFDDDPIGNLAAWCGYVTHPEVSLTTHRVLRQAYAARLCALPDSRVGKSLDSDSAAGYEEERQMIEQTMAHVWVLAANRIEPIDEEDTLGHQLMALVTPALVPALLDAIARDLRFVSPNDDHGQMVIHEALRLWDIVAQRVHDGRYPPSILSAVPSWAVIPTLPAEWRFSQVEGAIENAPSEVRNDWNLVRAVVDLAAIERPRALRLLDELLKRSDAFQAVMATRDTATDLLRAGLTGSPDERHLAQSINSAIVTNGLGNLLAD